MKVGAREGDEVEVTDGVKEGEHVAVPLAGEELRDGAPVASAAPAASPAPARQSAAR